MAKSKTRSYFAAANGYHGFRSYFNEVFNPEKNEEIFILKGGPGTGKSSFMRKISEKFEDAGFNIDLIYCSSDVRSLDGIIIEKDEKRVSLLDGTMPHQTDPKMPGAYENIINLGDSWNKNGLKKRKDEISEITKTKSSHYKSAYEYLSLAGKTEEIILSLTEPIFRLCDDDIIEIISKNKKKTEGRKRETVLLSAFGKDGYKRVFADEYIKENNYSVKGEFGSEYLFMRRLFALAERENDIEILFPSPLSENKPEGISLSSLLVFTKLGVGKEIDSSLYFDKGALSKRRPILESLESAKEKLLESAKEEFSLASEAHFMLEKIYSSEMDFKNNDFLLEKTCREIKEIFNY